MTPWQLRWAIKIVRRGGIIAYPTEAVFGLGCDPLDFDAVEAICRMKNRSLSKGLILIASDIEQVKPFISATPAQVDKLTKKTRTPTTWIMPAHPQCPAWLTGKHQGIAIRITRHPIAYQLCAQSGHPLVSTSANISHHPAARNALDVQRVFGESVDMIVHADTGGQNKPSEIREVMSNKVIRPR
jgi:L-threonylcarbamoyladenylate synthase